MTIKFKSKDLSEAKPEEVRAYALQFLGLPVEDATDKEVLAKVRAANDGTTIFVAEKPEAPAPQEGTAPSKPLDEDAPAEPSGGLVGSYGRDDPRVQLTLHAEDRDGVVNTRHKEVGVNGVVFLLKRGESINIPYRVFLALENAEREIITHDQQGNVRTQRVKNTPFNVERMPSLAEIKAWHARVDGAFVP